LNIKYKNGSTNHVVDCLNRPPVATLTTVLNSCGYETSGWPQIYKNDLEFTSTYGVLIDGKQVPDFHLHDALLCYLGHIFVTSSERAKLIWEVHYSQIIGYLSMEKNMFLLKKYFYWTKLQLDVGKYIKSYTACAIAKPSIKKKGLYTPLPTPSTSMGIHIHGLYVWPPFYQTWK